MMDSEQRERDILRAAQLYYYEGLTQAAIADRLGYTRWTVGRLLEDARDTGMVTITINHPHARERSLELELVDKYGVEFAIVVRSSDVQSVTVELVADAAADYLTGLRPAPHRMTVAWGRTMAAIARAIPARWTTGLEVLQANGGLAWSNDDVAASIGLMAKKGGGIGYSIPAPTIVRDPELGRRLREEPSVWELIHSAARADLAMFSPGAPHSDSVLFRAGYLTNADLSLVRSRGAVADVFSHFIGEDGQPVWDELEDRTIAVGLDELRSLPNSVVVGSGPLKARPLAVSLSGGLARGIITDSETAKQIIG